MQEKADDPNASRVLYGQVVPNYTFAKIILHVIKWCIRDLSSAGVDPGVLERGFIYIKVKGVCFADFISFSLNIQ